MRTQNISRKPVAGFSLIEVMVAVVVLAVGLLALVALQSNLVRSGADAKARSRIAALVSSRMDEARAAGYFALASQASVVCASNNDVCQAQNDAAVSNLAVARTVTTTTGANSSEYKTLTVSASWNDSTGTGRRLAMSTVVSPLSLDPSNTLLNQQLSGDVAKVPVVRTTDPATAGVVPIALGNGSSSAASNPTPELVGRQNNQEIVGTRFNVLTYVPSGQSAVIQKRIETAVIKCSCQYGAGGNNLPTIYRTAQWPAIWTGERYDVFKPSSPTNAPGQSLGSGPTPGVTQSPLCQECCRDHHDGNATGVAKFDPERSGATSKYNLANGELVEVTNTSSGVYLDACRIIRVDGLWRTAADMYSRQFGLLETQSVSNVKAKNGLPTSGATAAYTTFVKSYLRQYTGTTGTAPSNAQTLFDATAGLNEPSLVSIAAPSTTDYRYLHARGLYVDYLESAARAKIAAVLDDTGARGRCPTGTAKEDCVMPYLPFTSANLTEIAKWVASAPSVLVVNSGNLLATNPTEPSGGRSYGKSVGPSDNTASTGRSNAGIAVSTTFSAVAGVDPDDAASIASDVQAFEVGGTPGQTTGDDFFVTISGGGANPFAFYILGTDTGECVKQATGTRPCTTNSTLPMAGSVRLENYWIETMTTRRINNAACTDKQGRAQTASDDLEVPTFHNYMVQSASIGGTAGSIGTSVNDGRKSETTTITFASIPVNATVAVMLAEQTGSPTYATIASCIANNSTKIDSVIWNRPWE